MADPVIAVTEITLDGFRCISAAALYHEVTVLRGENPLPTEFWTQFRPNSYTCPRGKHPGRGYFLLAGKDYKRISRSGITASFKSGADSVGISNLYMVSAIPLYSSGAGIDDNQAVLVEVVDIRGRYFLSDLYRSFNVLRPAPATISSDLETTERYYSQTLNGSDLWHWNEVLDEIADNVTGLSLDTTDANDHDFPCNLRFAGVSAWDALCACLQRCGLEPAYNPTTGTVKAVSPGAAPTRTLEELGNQFKNSTTTINTGEASGTALAPAAIAVYFPRICKHHGSEAETLDNGGDAYNTHRAAYRVEASVGSDGVGIVPIHVDVPAIFSATDDDTPLNDADLTNFADRIAQDVRRKYQDHGLPVVYRFTNINVYSNVVPNSEIVETYIGDDGGPNGLCVEARIRDYLDPYQPYISHLSQPALGNDLMPQVAGGSGGDGGNSLLGQRPNIAYDPFAGPTVAQPALPVFPSRAHLVRIMKDDTTTSISRDWQEAVGGQKLYPARVLRTNPDGDLGDPDDWATEGETCWVVDQNTPEDYRGPLVIGETYLARLVGSADSGGTARPLYAIDQEQVYLGMPGTSGIAQKTTSLAADLHKGNTGAGYIYKAAVNLHAGGITDDAIELDLNDPTIPVYATDIIGQGIHGSTGGEGDGELCMFIRDRQTRLVYAVRIPRRSNDRPTYWLSQADALDLSGSGPTNLTFDDVSLKQFTRGTDPTWITPLAGNEKLIIKIPGWYEFEWSFQIGEITTALAGTTDLQCKDFDVEQFDCDVILNDGVDGERGVPGCHRTPYVWWIDICTQGSAVTFGGHWGGKGLAFVSETDITQAIGAGKTGVEVYIKTNPVHPTATLSRVVIPANTLLFKVSWQGQENPLNTSRSIY